MPIYAYACADCAHEFETLVCSGESPACPECGSRRLDRQISLIAKPALGGRARRATPRPPAPRWRAASPAGNVPLWPTWTSVERIQSVEEILGARRIVVAANGLDFEVFEAGGGERLALLLHGFPESALEWRGQMPTLLAKGFRVWRSTSAAIAARAGRPTAKTIDWPISSPISPG